MFIYLSYIIGTEDTVRIRRKIINEKFPYDVKILGGYMFASGSRAEGLDMKGSDTDIMVIDGLAYESDIPTGSLITYRYDSMLNNSQPGYVIVQFEVQGYSPEIYASGHVKTFYSTVFPFFKFALSFTPHGPAMTAGSCGEDLDIVLCLKSATWPKIASEWIQRKRKYGWPSQEIINDMESQGCHLVPVSSKLYPLEEREWRLSFSLAEREIIYSFNHTQLLVYGLLKITLKESINAHECISGILCSYFLKTTLFWTIEETPHTLWNSKYTMLCFHLCLNRLEHFIRVEKCPNYFVPTNNMFKGKFTSTSKDELLQIIRDIGSNVLHQFTISTTMRYLNHYLNDPLATVNLKKSLTTKYAIEIVKILLDFQKFGKRLLCSMCNSKAKYLKPYIKRILRITFVRTSAIPEVCNFINTEDTTMNNKMRYLMEKVNIELLLSGCRADLSSGKTILASWLYEKKKFKECLLVTDMALQSIQYRVFHADMISTTLHSLQEILHNISWSFLFRNLHMFYTVQSNFMLRSKLLAKDFSRVLAGFMNLASWDENYTRNNLTEFSFYPESYCFFLRYLCFLRLGNGKKSEKAFGQMSYVHYQNTDKYERNMYDLQIFTMRLAGSITKRKLENGTDNEDTISMNDFFLIGQDGIPAAVKRTDFSILTNFFKNINDFGLNPDFLRNGFDFAHSAFNMCKIQ